MTIIAPCPLGCLSAGRAPEDQPDAGQEVLLGSRRVAQGHRLADPGVLAVEARTGAIGRVRLLLDHVTEGISNQGRHDVAAELVEACYGLVCQTRT